MFVPTERGWSAIIRRGDWKDTLHVAAFVEGEIFTEVLKRCGNDVSRENFLKQATSLKDFRIPIIPERHRHRHRQRQLRHLSLVSTHSIRWGRQSNGRRPKRRLTAAIAEFMGQTTQANSK